MGEGWEYRAECRGQDTETFFPDKSKTRIAYALTFCQRCPVLEDCREFCDQVETRVGVFRLYGIFGGETPSQRRNRRKGTSYVGVFTCDRSQCEEEYSILDPDDMDDAIKEIIAAGWGIIGDKYFCHDHAAQIISA